VRVTQALILGVPLTVGFALALTAARQQWAPPLWVALVVGAVLRLVIMVIASRDAIQPYDLGNDFRDAADAVLVGRDPVVAVREGVWHFLPLQAYLLAGQRELGHLLGLPWSVAGRLLPVLADIALIPLVGRLAGSPAASSAVPAEATNRERGAAWAAHPMARLGAGLTLRLGVGSSAGEPGRGPGRGRGAVCSFQYACLPLGLMVSGIHGQFSAITLVFAVTALLAARAGRAVPAGLFAGLAVTSTSWAALVLPGVLAAAPAVRHRLTVLACTVATPAAFLCSSAMVLDTPVRRLPATAAAALSARPVTGDWGWTAVATGGRQMVSPTLGHIGTVLLVSGLLAAGWWWRKAAPVDVTVALLLTFLILTYRFGSQYLLWPVPYLIARASYGDQRRAWPALVAASVWAAFGYLHLTLLPQFGWPHARAWWAISSLIVIALLIRALPPRPPAAGPGHPPAPDERTQIPEPAT
jgi:hypothetical protein